VNLLLDLGAGNTDRIVFTLSKLNHRITSISSPVKSHSDDILIIPGVGSFECLMRSIHALDLHSFLHDWHAANKKMVCICAGFQILFEGSEESKPYIVVKPLT